MAPPTATTTTAAAAETTAASTAGVRPRAAGAAKAAGATSTPKQSRQPGDELLIPKRAPVSRAAPRSDFMWQETDEPHSVRRRLMLKKYPQQIRALMRHEPLTVAVVLGEVALQMALAYAFRDASAAVTSWRFWACAYVVGGTVSASLLLSVHEITHFLAFRSFLANKLLAVVANLPIVLPFCVDFKRYHMDHHRFQGVDGVDGDLPTELEAHLFNSTVGKLVFCATQILFYAFRPKLVATAKTYRMPRSAWEWATSWYAMNYAVQFLVMAAVYRYWGLGSILYLAVSVLLGGSLHPMAGHYLAEHYVTNAGQETYSYYGWLNILAFNVGYHIEHHDFPNIPWTLLPELRKIAPEFYDMPQCPSWTWMIIDFIRTPGMGPYSRIKRKQDVAVDEKLSMPAVVDDVSAPAYVGKEDQ
ncbi:hypothetical protein HK405_006204 [Cladochytrium tenue]|nr:hypothetical protein HK405_006204 [Cladochytrium tenue]